MVRIRAAVSSKQKYAPRPAEDQEGYEKRERGPRFEMQWSRRKRRPPANSTMGSQAAQVNPSLHADGADGKASW